MDVHLVAPAQFQEPGYDWEELDKVLEDMDIVMLLRVQHERHDGPGPDRGGAAAGLCGPHPGGKGAVPVGGRREKLSGDASLPLPIPAGHRAGAADLCEPAPGGADRGGAAVH